MQVSGLVQGVGLRPWVVRQAGVLGLCGKVRNTASGVEIWVEGDATHLQTFQERLRSAAPGHTDVERIEVEVVAPSGEPGFYIQGSDTADSGCSVMPRDTAACDACLLEMRDPQDRRYRYPFISCAACGPRFTIIEALPFYRERTSMRAFPMCASCGAQYRDPRDRRYHAQTIACSACGPQLCLVTADRRRSGNAPALAAAVALLRDGGVLALKGVGGFQLLARADHRQAVSRIRDWKQRQRKPLAVMCADIAEVERVCRVSAAERRALSAPSAPIVLLNVHDSARLPGWLAPGLASLGVMLPASPLHQLLADDLGTMLVVTSGNRRGEPLAVEDGESQRLLEVADGLLTHDRDILHMADDSIVRYATEQPIVLRHARGLAPTTLSLGCDTAPGIAYGGHLKGAAAVCREGRVTLLQHIGDMHSVAGQARLQGEASAALGQAPAWVAADVHPDYGSGAVARGQGVPLHPVYHHVAHTLALVAEQQIPLPVLGVTFDGTGLGADGGIWGGEFITVERTDDAQGEHSTPALRWRRVGSVLDFPLPGGEAAIRDPRRAALGLAWRVHGGDRECMPRCVRRLFTAREWDTLLGMLDSSFNCPTTTSVGRMFDALAACSGLSATAEFDGEPALRLEAAACGTPDSAGNDSADEHAIELVDGCWDWRGLVGGLMADIDAGGSCAAVAAVWHDALADMVLRQVQVSGHERVALCGGVFQNARLTAAVRTRLQAAGRQVYNHDRLPVNDGSLAVGQALAAAWGLVNPPGGALENSQPCV
jgi:hydrogenase maturation protein HypF